MGKNIREIFDCHPPRRQSFREETREVDMGGDIEISHIIRSKEDHIEAIL